MNIVFVDDLKKIYIDDKYLNKTDIDTSRWHSKTSFMDEFIKKNKNDYAHFYGEFSFRIFCLNNLRKRIEGKYLSNLDILGGVGVTARLFETHKMHSYVNDLDEDCYNILKDNFINVYKDDMYKFPYKAEGYDLIFVDFNNYTLKKYLTEYKDLTSSVFQKANKYVIINDCSVYYTNYGKKSFDYYAKILNQTVTNREELFKAFKKFYKEMYPDWSLIAVEHFYKSSYLLFQKVDNESLDVNFNDRKNFKNLLKIS